MSETVGEIVMAAQQGVEMIRVISPPQLRPIHYNNYPVFKSLREDFPAAVATVGFSDRVHYSHHGEAFKLAVNAIASR